MRPHYLFVVVLFCLYPLSPGLAGSKPDNNTPIILVMGDSLSAGFGIKKSRGWVDLLAKRLTSESFTYRVHNASISGETSEGGLTRLPGELSKAPKIVIIELGANDGLRGLSLQHLQANLDKMITLSKQAGASVLLIGMKLPTNYGPAYTNGFQNLYRDLADKYGLEHVPFLLEGVATRRELMQDDNLHPTAEAQKILLENIWPHLLPLLKK